MSPSPWTRRPRFWLGGLLLLGALTLHLPGTAADSAEKNALTGKAAEDFAQLKREVDAFEKLYHLEPTEAQLKVLLALTPRTAAHPDEVKEAKASADYRKLLQDLRAAFQKNDEEAVESLSEKLQETEEKEPAEVEDEFEVTDAALKVAPMVLRLFSAAQVISFLAALEEDVPDPAERLIDALIEGETMGDEEWKELREETADEVGWLLAGFQNDAAKIRTAAAAAFLDRGHRLKGPAFEKALPNLEKAARIFTAGVSPTTIIDHFLQRELAELLSNPQAAAVMRARLDEIKKK